jgi:uncharacterized SAM-binding protein YcdF (DUF218 family)
MKYLMVLILLLGVSNALQLVNNKKSVIILVLGSHDSVLLQDRMQTAINFAKQQDRPVKWFLSGGIKRQITSIRAASMSEATSMSEAASMSELLYNGNSNWKIQLDTLSKNTAENFAHFRKWIETEPFSEIVVVTSEFHHLRANSILTGIIDIPVKWVLSPKACSSCHRDEKVHSLNIKSDIEKALMIYNSISNEL